MDLKDSLTILIGIAVLIVTYAQWRTANQKVVVDLFDRRLRVFESIRDVIGEISREGEARPDATNKFWRAQADAEFLFGKDVQEYLEGFAHKIITLHTLANIPEGSPRFVEMSDHKAKVFMEITEFYKTAPAVFAPYIALTQKNTPFWRPW